MPIQVNWNSSVMATDTGNMVVPKLYSAGGACGEASPAKDSTRLGDSGTGRLPGTVSAAKGDGEQQRAKKNAWLAAVWVHGEPLGERAFDRGSQSRRSWRRRGTRRLVFQGVLLRWRPLAHAARRGRYNRRHAFQHHILTTMRATYWTPPAHIWNRGWRRVSRPMLLVPSPPLPTACTARSRREPYRWERAWRL